MIQLQISKSIINSQRIARAAQISEVLGFIIVFCQNYCLAL